MLTGPRAKAAAAASRGGGLLGGTSRRPATSGKRVRVVEENVARPARPRTGRDEGASGRTPWSEYHASRRTRVTHAIELRPGPQRLRIGPGFLSGPCIPAADSHTLTATTRPPDAVTRTSASSFRSARQSTGVYRRDNTRDHSVACSRGRHRLRRRRKGGSCLRPQRRSRRKRASNAREVLLPQLRMTPGIPSPVASRISRSIGTSCIPLATFLWLRAIKSIRPNWRHRLCGRTLHPATNGVLRSLLRSAAGDPPGE